MRKAYKNILYSYPFIIFDLLHSFSLFLAIYWETPRNITYVHREKRGSLLIENFFIGLSIIIKILPEYYTMYIRYNNFLGNK